MDKASSDKQADGQPFRLIPLGDAAVIIQYQDIIAPAVQRQVLQLSQCLQHHMLEGIMEWTVAYNSLTLFYNPWILSEKGHLDPFEQICKFLFRISEKIKAAPVPASRLLEIPVCYGGIFGPDLAYIADYHQLSPETIIQLHTEAEYLVYMLGFAPGFPYLGGMNPRLATPRKSAPRAKVPLGSVGIAGEQTGIYPLETPGGWQLIGQTPLRLFNPEQKPASLLQPGDRLKFKVISPEVFNQLASTAYEL